MHSGNSINAIWILDCVISIYINLKSVKSYPNKLIGLTDNAKLQKREIYLNCILSEKNSTVFKLSQVNIKKQ